MSDALETLEKCANCGEYLDEVGRWYPTLAKEVEDGLNLFAFCSHACRREFKEDCDRD